MSVTYEFELDDNLDPVSLLELLTKNLDFLPVGDGQVAKGGVVANALKHTRTHEIIVEECGVDPKIQVWFWLDPRADDLHDTTLAKAIVLLMLRTNKNAVVSFNHGDQIVLVRKNSRVTVIGLRKWLTRELDAAGIRYEQRNVIAPAA
jgi:hypothetical protein